MKIVAEYRKRAEDCERFAKQIASDKHRQGILKIAAAWREMADQREHELNQGRHEFLVGELTGHVGTAH
jgi:hypothetical protein